MGNSRLVIMAAFLVSVCLALLGNYVWESDRPYSSPSWLVSTGRGQSWIEGSEGRRHLASSGGSKPLPVPSSLSLRGSDVGNRGDVASNSSTVTQAKPFNKSLLVKNTNNIMTIPKRPAGGVATSHHAKSGSSPYGLVYAAMSRKDAPKR